MSISLNKCLISIQKVSSDSFYKLLALHVFVSCDIFRDAIFILRKVSLMRTDEQTYGFTDEEMDKLANKQTYKECMILIS